MKKHPDIGRKVNWAGQLCEITDATKHQVRLKFTNAAGAAEFWLDRTAKLYWADDFTPGTAPTLTLVDWLKACGCPCCTKPKQLFASVHARPAPCPKCRGERQVASRSQDGEVFTVCMKCGRIEKPEAKSL